MSSAGKKRAAREAATLVKDDMIVGIGTGSTAKFFIDCLGERIKEGWQLRGVPTSKESETLARAVGVEIITPDETTIIDLAVDGADEADPARNLIKGGGGALLREKIVAASAKKFVVIADKSKRVVHLGKFPLPVEIEPFGWALTVRKIRDVVRENGFDNPLLELRAFDGASFRSDGGNLIIDCALEKIENPTKLDVTIRAIPGVIETGLFCGLADCVVYGDDDGISIDGSL